MKIKQINTYLKDFELTRPYTVAYKTQTSAQNVIVEIITDTGLTGLGAASPAPEVTGETMNDCLRALDPTQLNWCIDRDLQDFNLLTQECVNHLFKTPAASAAVDIALHDLYAKYHQKPLVEVLGRVHQRLPTSITIGIKNVEKTLEEAQEYIDRGFKILKVKLGCDLAEDLERLIKLRECYGSAIKIRVDPNQGYSFMDLKTFFYKTKHLDIEFIEQPIQANKMQELHQLSQDEQRQIALDESIVTPQDAMNALKPTPCCGIFNIKLMKCGGITTAQKIAVIAHQAKIDVMWGCMDESIISIAAALHVAFASPATRYIDLDGSLDLANDIVSGGFCLKEGYMSVLPLPGLGVSKIEEM
jgi:o-succinylbenzoate synthase